MFSKNNKISKRQMFRLLTYDLLGIGTLLLPSELAKNAGKNGLLAILAGIAAGLLYCFLIGRLLAWIEENETYPAFLKRCFGKCIGTAALLFYAGYYICLGGYTAYIFGHLMITELLKEQSFYGIAAGIVLLGVYGIFQGIEGRARIYEILFWFLMAPLFLMLFFAARDVELPRLFPLYTADAETIAVGGFLSFAVFSIGGMSLFLAPFAKKKQSISGACMGAVLFSGFVLISLFGILQGIFGVSGIHALEYPAVTLMSMIQIPGGFFQRQDALMIAIWFFTMYALLSSSMFYAAENLKELTAGKKEKWWIFASAILLFGIAAGSYRSSAVTGLLGRIFLSAATPLAVIIPAAAWLCIVWRRKKKSAVCCLILFVPLLFLSGCSTNELENRKFPLAMGIDKEEDSCLISYKFQDLSAVANENADSPSGTDFFIKDRDFFTGINKYANNTNKIMDYNHMKTLILSEDFVEDEESLFYFMQVCGKESLIARNTLLFFADDAAEILKLDENLDTAIGSYLEEMLDSREDYKLKDTVTLGDLFNDMENKEQLLLVPVLAQEGGLPVIRSYYAVSGGRPKGEIGIHEAVLSYLSQGKLKKLAFTMEDGTPVSVDRISWKGKFKKGAELVYRNEISLEVIVEQQMETGSAGGEKLKKKIGSMFEKQLKKSAESLLEVPRIDLTNCFYRLGMSSSQRYEQYKDNRSRFLDALSYEFAVDVILLNERG